MPSVRASAFGKALTHRGFDRVRTLLGRAYYTGSGVPVDKAAALEWYRKAAEQGHARAQLLLDCHRNPTVQKC